MGSWASNETITPNPTPGPRHQWGWALAVVVVARRAATIIFLPSRQYNHIRTYKSLEKSEVGITALAVLIAEPIIAGAHNHCKTPQRCRGSPLWPAGVVVYRGVTRTNKYHSHKNTWS